MIKSSIDKTSTISKIKYPILMINPDKSNIILFTENTTGTVVWTNGGVVWTVGRYATDWRECESDYWKPFQGKVTLENP